jgi:hypothetical protein
MSIMVQAWEGSIRGRISVPKLFGQPYSKVELLRRVGHLSQIGGIEMFRYEDGPAKGVRALEFRTGTGLMFKVALDRGMDVTYCEFRGRSLAWIPPSQLPAPWFFGEQTQFGWLRTGLGGLINTCGLVHIGDPAEANVEHYNFPARSVERYGVHDRIALTPARLRMHGECWQGDECWLEARGEVQQAQPFGENLKLTRSYRAKLGDSSFVMEDEVENLGYSPTRHMLLYHINFGFPFIREDAKVMLPVQQDSIPKVLAGDVEQAVTAWRDVSEPKTSWNLQVFEHELGSLQDGRTSVGILQKDTSGEFCEGIYLTYNLQQLPIFLQTRLMGEGFYSIILEPATNGMGAEAFKAADDRIWLKPGEKRQYALEIGILEDAEACQLFLQRLANCTKRL